MKRIGKILDAIPYLALVIAAFVGASVPFEQPHLFEKTAMLFSGTLSRPIDIVDLFIHALPLILTGAKLLRDGVRVKRPQ